jgi:transcription elongation factor GreA
MRTQQTFLTPEGYQKLEQEMDYLRTVRRWEVAQRLEQALPEGDILENGELEDARNDQAFVEGRILALKYILNNATIIQETNSRGTVELGNYITVVDLSGDGTPETYRIVGSPEADPILGNISNESPLGRALMGQKVGDRVVIHAPDGEMAFEILGIR